MDAELDTLNAMLAAIGSSGISSTVGRHPGLMKCKPILDRVNRMLQARGHWFNTDWELKLLPTVDKEFILPQNTLKADTSNKAEPYVRRGRVMYDPTKHTSAIDIQHMLVDVVVQLAFNDLPWTAIEVIRTTATWQVVQNSDMDSIGIQGRRQDMNEAIAAFERERLVQADISLRDNPAYQRIMGGIKPQYSVYKPRKIGG